MVDRLPLIGSPAAGRHDTAAPALRSPVKSRLAPPLCATVGEYITGIVLKELGGVQLLRSDCPSVSAVPLHELLAAHVPDLAADLLETAAGWIPGLADARPSTLLPDLDQFPPNVHEVDGLSVQHRKLLQEALEIILDAFQGAFLDLPGGLLAEGPLLPRPCIASIAAQVAMLIEHICWLRPRSAGCIVGDDSVDLSVWEQVCLPAGAAVSRGSKAELVEELQQCRQRIFQLEKELAKQGRSADAHQARARREHERDSARLLEVNHALEGKLRQQLVEVKGQKEKISDHEQRVKFEQWHIQEKCNRIEELEREVAGHRRKQDDMLVRERAYGRRILDLNLHEFESSCRNDQRIRNLGMALAESDRIGIDGMRGVESSKKTSPIMMSTQSENHLADLAKETLGRLKRDFDEIFEEREKRFFSIVCSSEAALLDQQAQFEDIREQTYTETFGAVATRHGLSPRSPTKKRTVARSTMKEVVDVAVQTDPPLPEGSDCGTPMKGRRISAKQPRPGQLRTQPVLQRAGSTNFQSTYSSEKKDAGKDGDSDGFSDGSTKESKDSPEWSKKKVSRLPRRGSVA